MNFKQIYKKLTIDKPDIYRIQLILTLLEELNFHSVRQELENKLYKNTQDKLIYLYYLSVVRNNRFNENVINYVFNKGLLPGNLRRDLVLLSQGKAVPLKPAIGLYITEIDQWAYNSGTKAGEVISELLGGLTDEDLRFIREELSTTVEIF